MKFILLISMLFTSSLALANTFEVGVENSPLFQISKGTKHFTENGAPCEAKVADNKTAIINCYSPQDANMSFGIMAICGYINKSTLGIGLVPKDSIESPNAEVRFVYLKCLGD